MSKLFNGQSQASQGHNKLMLAALKCLSVLLKAKQRQRALRDVLPSVQHQPLLIIHALVADRTVEGCDVSTRYNKC